MTISADALLAGPRGRHMCLAVAHRLHEPVWAAWLNASWHPSDSVRRAALVSALHAVEVGPLESWVDPESFAGAISDSVDRAMYWQAPDDQDVIAATPDVTHVLRPIAEAIGQAPGAQWWATGIDLENQRYADLHDLDEGPDSPDLGAAADKLAVWKQDTVADEERAQRERPADPEAAYSGYWWSTPTAAGVLRTTRALPRTGAVQLLWEEDGLGNDAASVWATRARPGIRVYEITDPDAWTALVRRYPLEVTWSRRHGWYRTTGRAGAWSIPDWDAVAHDYDAVHLTVLGYLTTATRALDLTNSTATMLAGWDPDETFWLTDTLQLPDPEPHHWTRLASFGGADVEWQEQTPPDLTATPGY